MYKVRAYRDWMKSEDLVSFQVVEKETDLFIAAKKRLEEQAREAIWNYRKDIEGYIRDHPDFYSSLTPVDIEKGAPEIVRVMGEASGKANVGPMAAVAGAIAEFVGKDLLKFSSQVIVENGGDIFIKTDKPRALGIYAGDRSPFTGKIALEIAPAPNGVGVCTSSGKTSHSLSFGKADAALIISDDTALADAVATATGNIVKDSADIEKGIGFARSIRGVNGVLILVGDKMGSWGAIKLI